MAAPANNNFTTFTELVRAAYDASPKHSRLFKDIAKVYPIRMTTRLFIDCEFNSYRGELISMALVAEDGREFYKAMMPRERIDPWVLKNVIPVLQTGFCDREQFGCALFEFLSQFEAIELLADWPDDLKYFYEAVVIGPGTAITCPPIVSRVVNELHSRDSAVPHNALHDARAIRDLYLKPQTS